MNEQTKASLLLHRQMVREELSMMELKPTIENYSKRIKLYDQQLGFIRELDRRFPGWDQEFVSV